MSRDDMEFIGWRCILAVKDYPQPSRYGFWVQSKIHREKRDAEAVIKQWKEQYGNDFTSARGEIQEVYVPKEAA